MDELSLTFTGIQAAGSLLTGGALFLAFAQLRAARKQLTDSRAWNKMSFALTYLPHFDMFFAWEAELDETFVRIIGRNSAMSEREVKQLFEVENSRVHLLLKTYLNALEAYCVAINCGLAHEEIAKRVWGYKLIRHFVELRPYIVYIRAHAHDAAIFLELEKVYARWSKELCDTKLSYGLD